MNYLFTNKNYKCKCDFITENGNISKGKIFTGKKWKKLLFLSSLNIPRIIFKNLEEIPVKLLTN